MQHKLFSLVARLSVCRL